MSQPNPNLSLNTGDEKPFLSDNHYTMLTEESGISDEVIQARGYRTVTQAKELADLGFTPSQRSAPGLLIPLHTTDGNTALYVYRPDHPRVIEDKSKREADGKHPVKVLKYEIPKGVGVRIDCPPACFLGLRNPQIPLFITEGQKKADALATHGACAIDLLGVWNFKGKNEFGGKTVLADFDFIAWDGRKVFIVFDSDVMYKPSVRLALERLTEILSRKGACLSSIYLPNDKDGRKFGVDDWLAKGHTLAEVEAFAEGPRSVPQPALPLLEILDEPTPVLRRPLSLIGEHAYAVTWLPVRSTLYETKDKDGNILYHNPPIKEEKLRLFVIRNDGQIFGEVSDRQSARPLSELGVEVHLSEIIPPEKRWSTRGVRAYFQGQRPDPVDVFIKVKAVINRFLDFDRSLTDQEAMSELLSCYVFATYLLDAFNVIGFLWPNGEKGSGKTNLLIIVSELAYLGQVVLGGGSFASLRDLADYGATLAFDDAENLSDPKQTDPDKRALLLAGNRRGSTVPLKEQVGPGKWSLRYVNAYCPRLFSAIRLPDPVLSSRTIVIPLIRTGDREKANSDPLDYGLWPYDRRSLIDDLWAIGLANLPFLRLFENYVSNHARLAGRNLQPWKAILAVAAWLDSVDTEKRLKRWASQDKVGSENPEKQDGLWGRLENLSWRYHQEEGKEIQSGDLTTLLIQSLCRLAETRVCDNSDIKDNNDISIIRFTFTTQQISEATVSFAENSEADVDKESISSRRIGRMLGKLRFQKSRESGKGTRQWIVTLKELSHWAGVYNLEIPSELNKLFENLSKRTDEVHASVVTHVTDEKTSQTPPSFYQECTIVLRLPGDSKFPTIAKQWRRLADGSLEAGYQIDELAMALSIFLEKDIDVKRIQGMSNDQLGERITAVTRGKILQFKYRERSD